MLFLVLSLSSYLFISSSFEILRTESVVSDLGVAHVVVGGETDSRAVRLRRLVFL